MIEITEKFEVFEFDELQSIPQTRALNHLIKMWELMPSLAPWEVQDKIKGALAEAEFMQTPWFAGEFILEHCHEELYEELRKRFYLADGDYYGYIKDFHYTL